VKQTLDAKHAPVSAQQIIQQSSHLSLQEKSLLLPMLQKHKQWFNGTLGKWKDVMFDIELKDKDCAPVVAKRAHPVLRAQEKTLRLEIDGLVKPGALQRINRSKWAAPSFLIPKKDLTVRFISDLRELNKLI
jgi:hypothetical protein